MIFLNGIQSGAWMEVMHQSDRDSTFHNSLVYVVSRAWLIQLILARSAAI